MPDRDESGRSPAPGRVDEPSGFVLREGVLRPVFHEPEQHRELLRDYGLAYAATHESLFGRRWPPEDVAAHLATHDPWVAIGMAAQLARHVALNRVSDLRDPGQASVVQAAIRSAQARGIAPVAQAEDRPIERSCAFGPETTNGLIAVSLWAMALGAVPGRGIREPDTVSRACLAINDYVTGPRTDHEPGSDNFHIENMRRAWIQAPLLLSLTSASDRLQRAERLSLETLGVLRPDLRTQVEEAFRESYGVGPEEFFQLVPLLVASWALTSKDQVPHLEIPGIDESRETPIVRMLSALSDELEGMAAEASRLAPRSLGDQRLLQRLVRRPFVRQESSRFVLMGPHLLVRMVELALPTAFIENKPPDQPVQDVLGPMGQVAEAYARGLVEQAVRGSSGSADLRLHQGDEQLEGLGDVAIVAESAAVIAEVKNRQPPLPALAPTEEGFRRFSDWFIQNYLRPPPRPGALYQLHGAVRRARESGIGGIRPYQLLPVFINPQALIFEYDLYELLGRKAAEDELFGDGTRVAPFLILGLDDLETLARIDFAETGRSVVSVLLTKARHEAGRLTSWGTIIERMGLDVANGERVFPEDWFRRAIRAVEASGVQVRAPLSLPGEGSPDS